MGALLMTVAGMSSVAGLEICFFFFQKVCCPLKIRWVLLTLGFFLLLALEVKAGIFLVCLDWCPCFHAVDLLFASNFLH